ncbi:hypothetical protein [Zunongwangia sp.]|uniref:hypothetical protein n=1 Tax=Zunongwangia sp. TaxID=1965325 RepID=UPI003AA863D0
MKKILTILFAFLILSCGSRKNSAKSDRFTLESLEGKTNSEILELYPDAQPESGTNLKDVIEEEAEDRQYTILYPDTPDEILISWKDDAKTSIYDIYYNKDGKWQSEKGIQVGTSYDQLVKLNEKPIQFYGFGWDYSGAVDWNGGKLEDSNIRVFLAPEGDIPNPFYGDRIIKASEEEIAKLNLKVAAIMYRK